MVLYHPPMHPNMLHHRENFVFMQYSLGHNANKSLQCIFLSEMEHFRWNYTKGYSDSRDVNETLIYTMSVDTAVNCRFYLLFQPNINSFNRINICCTSSISLRCKILFMLHARLYSVYNVEKSRQSRSEAGTTGSVDASKPRIINQFMCAISILLNNSDLCYPAKLGVTKIGVQNFRNSRVSFYFLTQALT